MYFNKHSILQQIKCRGVYENPAVVKTLKGLENYKTMLLPKVILKNIVILIKNMLFVLTCNGFIIALFNKLMHECYKIVVLISNTVNSNRYNSYK